MDFGLGYDDGRGKITFNVLDENRESQSRRMHEELVKKDCRRFSMVVNEIWEDREEDEEPDDVRALADRQVLIGNALKKCQQFGMKLLNNSAMFSILEGPLIRHIY